MENDQALRGWAARAYEICHSLKQVQIVASHTFLVHLKYSMGIKVQKLLLLVSISFAFKTYRLRKLQKVVCWLKENVSLQIGFCLMTLRLYKADPEITYQDLGIVTEGFLNCLWCRIIFLTNSFSHSSVLFKFITSFFSFSWFVT